MWGTKYFMLMPLYHKEVSYACYAHAYVRTERYAYVYVQSLLCAELVWAQLVMCRVGYVPSLLCAELTQHLSKHIQFIYLAFEKTDPLFIVQNVDLFIYCLLMYYTHLLLVVRQISQSIFRIPREQAASKNIRTKNIRIYRNVRKWGLSHTNQK